MEILCDFDHAGLFPEDLVGPYLAKRISNLTTIGNYVSIVCPVCIAKIHFPTFGMIDRMAGHFHAVTLTRYLFRRAADDYFSILMGRCSQCDITFLSYAGREPAS